MNGEASYRTLVENAREGLGLLNSGEDGTVEYCNRAYAEILGLLPDELVGRSFFDFLDGRQKEKMLRQRPGLRSGRGSSYELCATVADGRRKHLSCDSYPVFDRDGSCRGVAHAIVDVTERKRAESALRESEERFMHAFEAAAVGLAHVTPDGCWIRVNRKLSEIVGYTREELLGSSFREISHPDDLDGDLYHVERMLEGEINGYSVEKRCLRKDGSRAWLNIDVSLAREPHGGQAYFALVVEDVTRCKLAELLPEPLTRRELEIIRQIVAGLTNPQIARCLSYSLGTVKLSMQRVFAKLGVRNRKQAAARAVEIGLVPPHSP